LAPTSLFSEKLMLTLFTTYLPNADTNVVIRGAAMTKNKRRSGVDRRTTRDRRRGADTRSEEKKRLQGERRSGSDRRSGLDRRLNAAAIVSPKTTDLLNT
jgi:hypothetical protein